MRYKDAEYRAHQTLLQQFLHTTPSFLSVTHPNATPSAARPILYYAPKEYNDVTTALLQQQAQQQSEFIQNTESFIADRDDTDRWTDADVSEEVAYQQELAELERKKKEAAAAQPESGSDTPYAKGEIIRRGRGFGDIRDVVRDVRDTRDSRKRGREDIRDVRDVRDVRDSERADHRRRRFDTQDVKQREEHRETESKNRKYDRSDERQQDDAGTTEHSDSNQQADSADTTEQTQHSTSDDHNTSTTNTMDSNDETAAADE